jgi:diketogulonate reductase-like aldo/keto reductase
MSRTVSLPDGEEVPALGLGTWMMAEQVGRRAGEIAALRAGIECGLSLIDTAEMYADGASESLVGEALAGQRDRVFLVSKAYPHNAGRASLPRACEQSLRRLKTDRIDLYLLHWRGTVPLAETVEAMEQLRAAGKIRHWGVSNFDTGDMAELLQAGGEGCAANQILYNLSRRGPEFDLFPAQAAARIPMMAYSPIEQGRLKLAAALVQIAAERGATAFQVALAWILRRGDIIAIPKAGSAAHTIENHGALAIVLTIEELARLDEAFPAPRRKTGLAML